MGKRRKKRDAGAAAGGGEGAGPAAEGDVVPGPGDEAPADDAAAAEGAGAGTEAQTPETGAAPGPTADGAGTASGAAASRRDFLATAGSLVVGACAVGATAGAARMAVPDAAQGPPPRFPLGRPADFKVNTLTWIRERDLFVVRDGQGFGAFSARCTHLGCTVRRTADGFFCPCHGARFDGEGTVLGGPAPAPLPWFEVWLEADGRVWVDTARRREAGIVVLGAPAGARR